MQNQTRCDIINFPPGKSRQIISYSPNLLPYSGRETRISQSQMIHDFKLSVITVFMKNMLFVLIFLS